MDGEPLEFLGLWSAMRIYMDEQPNNPSSQHALAEPGIRFGLTLCTSRSAGCTALLLTETVAVLDRHLHRARATPQTHVTCAPRAGRVRACKTRSRMDIVHTYARPTVRTAQPRSTDPVMAAWAWSATNFQKRIRWLAGGCWLESKPGHVATDPLRSGR